MGSAPDENPLARNRSGFFVASLRSGAEGAASFRIIMAQAHFYCAINLDADDRLVEKLQSVPEQVKAKGRFNAIIVRYR